MAAIVFGASRCLGLAVAERLASEGCHVVAVGRSLERLEKAVSSIRASGADVTPMQCDMGSKQSIHDLVVSMRQSVGDTDIVVYNNGGPPDSSFETATVEDFLAASIIPVMGFALISGALVTEMNT